MRLSPIGRCAAAYRPWPTRKAGFLMPRLKEEWWREPTLLLAGIMRQATPLVSQILDYERKQAADTDKLTYRFLAFVCAHEAEVDEAVRQQVFREFTALGHEGAHSPHRRGDRRALSFRSPLSPGCPVMVVRAGWSGDDPDPPARQRGHEIGTGLTS